MDESTTDRELAPAMLRASDADREQLATLLQQGYTEGRLTFDELQERLEKAYSCRTMGELVALRADLPSNTSPSAATKTPPRPPELARLMMRRILTYVLIMLFLIAIWAASGRHGSFWPIWPIVVGGFILGLGLLGVERRGRGYRRRLARYEDETRARDRSSGR